MQSRKRLIPRALKAEAATWLARLRNEERSAADEAAFQAWLAENPQNAAAFDLVTGTWDAAGGLVTTHMAAARPEPMIGRRKMLAAGLAAVAVVSTTTIMWQRTSPVTYETQRGEQRRIALADGSSLTLDTETLIRVGFTAESRNIELVRGRAHFDVAKDPNRPFRVNAAGREVVALGTAFDVARNGEEVAILLVEGRVAVQPVGIAANEKTAFLKPGERIVYARHNIVRQEHPDINRATAWQEGRATFDNQPLAIAVAEMNRYSRRPLVVADADLAAMRISGTYSTRDAEAFARSVTNLLPAVVRSTAQEVLIEPIDEKFDPQS